MTDLYEVLGIARDASPEEIKKAYRKKAFSIHPDHDGGQEEMAVLNEAKRVLLDAKKRADYDAGRDERGPANSIEALAEKMLTEDFFALLKLDDIPNDIVGAIKRKLINQKLATSSAVGATKAKMERIERHKSRIKGPAEFNLAHMVATELLAGLQRSIDKAEENMEVMQKALAILEEYSDQSESNEIYRRVFLGQTSI